MASPETDVYDVFGKHIIPSYIAPITRLGLVEIGLVRQSVDYAERGSINPNVNNFREFPSYLKKLDREKTIAMFCTGGIRCEKASTFLKKKGFKNVFQLKGGIFNYLNKINIKKSLWKGECFVFDNRVSVKYKLALVSYSMCRGCRMPVSVQEKKSSKYKEGISCPYCYNKLTKSQKDRFSMRQKQILIARKLNKAHIYQKEY